MKDKNSMGKAGEERVFYESWLEKRAEWRFAWDKRYFTLDDTRLAYRIEENTPEKKWGTVASLDCRPDANSDTLQFRVWLLEGGSWTLRAPDRDAYERWMSTLFSALHSSLSTDHSNDRATSVAASESSSQQAVSGSPAEESNMTPPRPTRDDESRSNTSPQAGISTWGIVQLTAQVEKQAAWTGRWRIRIIELSEGYQLCYRHTPGGTIRARYTILALDYADATTPCADRLLLFTTSLFEQFWVRFATREERDEWYQTVYKALQERCSWQWMPLQPDDCKLIPNRLSSGKTHHNGAPTSVRLHYHSVAAGPGDSDRPTLYIYGGAAKSCRQVFNPEARAFLPHAATDSLSRSLATMQLYGHHHASLIIPDPFEERQHVKVRPPPLYGATLTACYETDRTQLVLLGGMSSASEGLPNTEVWAVQLPVPDPVNGMTTQQPTWARSTLPTYELPRRAFHDVVLLPSKFNKTREISAASPPHRLLLSGGLDESCRTRGECYIVELPVNPNAVSIAASAHLGGYLPEARAFHRMVVLADDTLVIVGGRGEENCDLVPVLTLPAFIWQSSHISDQTPFPEKEATISPWLRVQWSKQQWALPSMPDVAVSATEDRKHIVVLSQLTSPRHLLKIFLLDFEDATEDENGEFIPKGTKRVHWTEVAIRVGTVPRRIDGATIHVHHNYIYVLGCGENAKGTGSDDGEPQVCRPMRILMRNGDT